MTLKLFEVNSLRADLAAIDTLLCARNEKDDPIGWYQLNIRKSKLEEKLQLIEQRPEGLASIALFFGGKPVFGSKGVLAEFAGKTLESFQELVQKRYSVSETGELGARGPVRGKNDAQLMVVDVARGSFGFILEEMSNNLALADTSLKKVLDEVAELVANISSVDEERYGKALDSLDERTLISLRTFFKVLSDNEATIRLVEKDKEFILQKEDVSRAHERIAYIEIKNEDVVMEGTLYMLPLQKRFEFHLSGTQEVIAGPVMAECVLKLIGEKGREIPTDTLGKAWRVSLSEREVVEKGRKAKKLYALKNLILKLEEGEIAPL